MQAFLMAPLSALSAVVMFYILLNLTAAPRASLFLALLYASAISSRTISGALISGLGLSAAAWLPTGLLVTLSAGSMGHWLGPLAGLGVFSTSTLLGGMTLMPAGVGSTGSLMIAHLQAGGIPLSDSLVIISLIRLATVGTALTVGGLALISVFRILLRTEISDRPEHFDVIAKEYSDQFLDHVWNHFF